MDVDIIRNVNWLTDAFVQYELKIRGRNLRGTTMNSRKRTLISVLEEEQNGVAPSLTSYLSEEANLAECTALLEIITAEVEENLLANCQAAEVKVMFLHNRLSQLKVVRSQNAVFKTELVAGIETLTNKFNNVSIRVDENEVVKELTRRSMPNFPPPHRGIDDFLQSQSFNVPRYSYNNRWLLNNEPQGTHDRAINNGRNSGIDGLGQAYNTYRGSYSPQNMAIGHSNPGNSGQEGFPGQWY